MPERVVILGGGFGGIGAARELKGVDVEVVLVDQHDYHTFQPLLYQVATDLLETTAVGHPLRDLFHDQPNVTVHEATVVAVDADARQVQFAEMAPVGYDHLVLALGAHVNFFGVDGAGDHAFPLYTLADAVRLKEHILDRWEAADRDPGLVDDGVVNVVVVGGGPTGIESAGALSELYRNEFAKDYPHLPQERIRIVLVEAGDDIFTMFRPEIREYTRAVLAERSVEVMVGETVASVTPTRVQLASGKSIDAHTLVWGAGLQANPVAAALGVDVVRGGRIPVGPDLTVAGHPEIFAVGDIAAIEQKGDEKPLPQLGSVALQSGEHAGASIAAQLKGKQPKPFRYHDKGTMATIGRMSAVIQTRHGRTITGPPASLAWGAVHLALLSTGEDRAKAMIDWTWAGFSHERAGRISVKTEDAQPAAH
jgi:NADH dehydrogenase